MGENENVQKPQKIFGKFVLTKKELRNLFDEIMGEEESRRFKSLILEPDYKNFLKDLELEHDPFFWGKFDITYLVMFDKMKEKINQMITNKKCILHHKEAHKFLKWMNEMNYLNEASGDNRTWEEDKLKRELDAGTKQFYQKKPDATIEQ